MSDMAAEFLAHSMLSATALDFLSHIVAECHKGWVVMAHRCVIEQFSAAHLKKLPFFQMLSCLFLCI